MLILIWKNKGIKITKTILKKNKAGGITLPKSNTQYKATVITDILVNGQTDQGNRNNPEIEALKYV